MSHTVRSSSVSRCNTSASAVVCGWCQQCISTQEHVIAALAAICMSQPKRQAAVATEQEAVTKLMQMMYTRRTAVLDTLRSHPTAGCDIPDDIS